MSEYQYYEFQAIDRSLTRIEVQELRAYSTRALITPTSFVNHYEWGSFKGDVDAWMAKYFDAFLYLANWCTRVVKFALPSRLLDLKTARMYCPGGNASVFEVNGRVILTFVGEPPLPFGSTDARTDSCVGQELGIRGERRVSRSAHRRE